MSITVSKYQFDGPYLTTDYLKDNSGVYAILCKNDSTYHPVDVGESAKVKTRVDNHDRKTCWQQSCHADLAVAVLYTPNLHQQGRMEIEREIRNEYNFPCGAW